METIVSYLETFDFIGAGYFGLPYLYGAYQIQYQDDSLSSGDYGYAGLPFIVWSNS